MNKKNVFLIKAGILAYIIGFICNFIGTKGWTEPMAVEINPWGQVNSLRFALSDIFYLRAFQLVISVGDIFLAAFICLIFAGLLGNLIAEAKITWQKQNLEYNTNSSENYCNKYSGGTNMNRIEQKTIFLDYKSARIEAKIFQTDGTPWHLHFKNIKNGRLEYDNIECDGTVLDGVWVNSDLDIEYRELERLYHEKEKAIVEKLHLAIDGTTIDLERPIWRAR